MKKIILGVVFAAVLLWSASALAASGCIGIAWDAYGDSTITGFKVYTGAASRTYGPVAISLPTPAAVGYTISGLVKGTTYFIAITAYEPTSESGYSNEVSAVAGLCSPGGLKIVTLTK
jgi:hypothetical protein